MDDSWHYLGSLPVLLTLVMLLDAHRRGVESFWYCVILFVPVVGPIAYGVMVILPNLGFQGISWPQWGPSLAELRYRAEQTPTLTNHLALAERLVHQQLDEEAVPHLDAALVREPDHCQVLYLLATCRARSANPDQALPLLEQIINRDRYWSNYAAWNLLIEVRTAVGDGPGALSACSELARLSPTLEHVGLLAKHLLEHDQRAEALRVLEKALDDYHYSPRNLRWRNRRWAAEARRLVKQAQD